MTRSCLFLLLALAAQPVFVALAAQTVVVSQSGRAFSASAVRIKAGDRLRFTNADEFLHQIYVRAAAFSFTSREQEPGEAVEVLFPTPGSFDVRCQIHPKMLLTVAVE
jgi:plastocyanin